MSCSGIVLDMDGVIADFYSVPNWLPMLQNKNPAPYAIAKPIGNYQALNAKISALQAYGVSVEIVSWLARDNTDKAYDAQVRRVKRQWVKRYFPSIKKIHVVKHGTNKWRVASNKSAILFDDELPNCERWNKHSNRGHSIHVQDAQTLYNAIDSILREIINHEN